VNDWPRKLLLGAMLAVVLTARAVAQVPPTVDLPSLIGGARLGAGYAQMIGTAAVPGISSANYRIDSEGGSPTLDVMRVPYEQRWRPISDNTDLYLTAAGGYMRFKDHFSMDLFQPSDAGISSRWTGYSVSGGMLAKVRLGNGLSLEPAIDLGLARLENSAGYSGTAAILKPSFDGLLFNWGMNAWLVTPSVGLEWGGRVYDGKLSTRGRVARSWISSSDEPDPVLAFAEAVNIYSVTADYAKGTSWRLFDRQVSWVLRAGLFGYFGANRDALGFDSVAEIGGGFEVPVAADMPGGKRLRLVGSYLIGPNIDGWSVGLSVKF
jgi:hypothetical protein